MQERYDCHIHTHFSTDSTSPMRAMAAAAAELGLSGIAITDHYHPAYPEFIHRTGQPTAAYHHAIDDTAEAFAGKLKVFRGLEMGILLGPQLPVCEAAAAAYPYDFLLAAFHSTSTETFDGLGKSGAMPSDQLRLHYYHHVLECISAYHDYDVLAHVNLIDRYTKDLDNYGPALEVLDEIFRLAIREGKGIEINTSSYRYGMGERTTPTLDMLRRFRELGGEIVTVGSDAHAPNWVGSHLDDGYELLRAAGFTHFAVFVQRKPQFFPL